MLFAIAVCVSVADESISATCEMFVRKLDGVVERKLDEDVTGLNLYQFL